MDRDAIRRLLAELDAYEAMVRTIAELRQRDDSGRLQDLVKRRRDLVGAFPRIREIGLSVFADHPALDDFRSRLSDLQHRVLLLQADWPAVSITARSNDYARAASNVARANKDFIAWVRNTLDERR